MGVVGLVAIDRAHAQSTPQYTIAIQALKVADSDGGRATDVTPDQVKRWVDRANAIYAIAGIQFEFNPDLDGLDWSTINNTTLNNLSSSGTGWDAANAVAAEYPGKLVVFFRHGEGANPTGNGFSFPPASGLMTNFVAMPGFDHTAVITGKDASGNWIWKQNIWLFAHEVGHYFGLYHTFPGWNDSETGTPAGAASYITAHGGTASALDGDGIADTPPEAGTAFYINQGWDPCVGHDSYTISSMTFTLTFTPDRHNVMSYFACDPMTFTSMQVDVMQRTLEARLTHAIRIVDVTAITGETLASPVTSWQTADGPYTVEHLAGTTSGGDLIVFFWSPRHDWQAVNVSAITGETLAGPVTSWQTADGPFNAEHLAGMTRHKDLMVFFWLPPSDWQAVNVSAITGETLASPVTWWWTPDGSFLVEHLAGVSSKEHLLVFYWSR
jgi:hypothetical protein